MSQKLLIPVVKSISIIPLRGANWTTTGLMQFPNVHLIPFSNNMYHAMALHSLRKKERLIMINHYMIH